jgi:phosphoglycolate phosphatase-like HAD superfamily hydrolase
MAEPRSGRELGASVRPRISTVITDLDNTLFDWVAVWHQSFKAMLDRLVEESGTPQEVLEAEFKTVFRRHGTSEYAFAIEELPSLQGKHPGENLAERYESAIHSYNSARRATLCLYPTVLDTLEALKDKGCLIVGYTESMAYYSGYRLRKLGLDRMLDFLYSPPDHDLPRGLTPTEIRRYPPEAYELRRTVSRHTPKGELKPSPRVLSEIIAGVGAVPEETIYIGDNLMKDIAMAKAARVTAVWSKYGVAQNRPEYELLRRVTHWAEKDVAREKKLTPSDIGPDFELGESLSEILQLFEFVSFIPRSDERMKSVLGIWNKTIDVQQHFNDLELRIRNYAVTLLVAVLGATAFAIKESLAFSMFGVNVPLATAVLGAGLIGWFSFYCMDRLWYHRLLYGAVKHGTFIENRLRRVLPEICLTEAIGANASLTCSTH